VYTSGDRALFLLNVGTL